MLPDYKEAIDKLPIGYALHKIIFDNDKVVDYEFLDVNKTFVNYVGINKEDIVGKRVTDILPKITESSFDWIGYYGNIAEKGIREEIVQYFDLFDKWYRIFTYSPKKNYFIAYFIDITDEIKNIEEKETILHAINQMVFELDLDYRFINAIVNDESELYINKEAFINKRLDEIFKGDLGKKMVASCKKSLITKETQKIEYKLKIKDEHKYYKAEFFCVELFNKKKFIVNVIDITTEKIAEMALKKSELRYEELARESRVVTWEVNDKGKYIYINPICERVYGYKPSEIIDKKYFYELFPKDLIKEMQIRVKDFLSNDEKGKVYNYEHKILKKDGTINWVTTNALPIFSKNGKFIGYRGMDIDITTIKESEEKIKYLSFHDQLTGLYNRRFFEEELKRLDVERNLPLSLVMIDANGLKIINDAFGHIKGDLLLKTIANVLQNESREDDIISRVGGDEFIMLLPRVDLENSKKILNRVYNIAKKMTVDGINISFSYGCATKYNEFEEIDDIYKRAESEMYKIKNKEKSTVRKKILKNIINELFKICDGEKRHAESVRSLSVAMGKRLRLSEEEIEGLKLASFYHDIGKIIIDRNLLKDKKILSEEEIGHLRKHSETGYIILNSVNEYSIYASDILHHHENYDGSGYPKGISGYDIPINSRIISIAEYYDNQVNRKRNDNMLNKHEVLTKIRKESGRKFDPVIVNVFLKIISDL